jgi:rod shape-determining protein MreD
VKAAGVILAVAGALILQTTFARFVTRDTVPVDFVLVAVVYAALKTGPVAGLLAGTFGGLIQDALSSGVIGIGGLAKSTVGFAAGVIGTQFIVAKPMPRLVVFAGATVAHAILFMGLYQLLGLGQFVAPYVAVVGQAASNAVVGVVALQVADLLPGAVERRRAARPRLRR